MLPLSFNYLNGPFFGLISLICILSACRNRNENNAVIIKALDESLSTSNKLLSISTNDFLVSMREKLNDPSTLERAQYWFPKAQKIESLSNDANSFIEKIKAGIIKESKENDDRTEKIFDNLINYKLAVMSVDPKIDQQFNKSLSLFSSSFDSSSKSGEDLYNRFFRNSNVALSLAILTRLQNNIRIIENKVIMFCHEQIGTRGGRCTFISPIVGQNSSVVSPGGKIEIFAGVGEFYTNSKPEVFVFDKLKPLNENALAICKFKAETKPGKYYVPVKISYSDQDGVQRTVEKEIEYTVAEIIKQE